MEGWEYQGFDTQSLPPIKTIEEADVEGRWSGTIHIWTVTILEAAEENREVGPT